jgi:methylated-DNA-[protein]-cysteine S-methyltransferase
MEERFSLFDTPPGTGAIAWTDRGVSGLQLPEPEAARVRSALRRHHPPAVESPPPLEIQDVIDRITALLSGDRGQRSDLSAVRLDLERVPAFERQVYALTRAVAAGETVSYGQIARRLGDVRLARDVGQALARNPFPIVVPCHRVVATGGKLGGFSARGGVATKQRLLAIEQANVSWQLPLESA